MSDPDVYRRLAALERWRDDQLGFEQQRFVGARYQTDAGQSIPNNTETVINFEDATFDPDALVTVGAAWVFTAPIAGYYRVSAHVLFETTTAWADGEALALTLYKNGSSYSVLHRRDNNASGASTFIPAAGTDVVQLVAGNTIDVRVQQASGGALALFTAGILNYIAIERVA